MADLTKIRLVENGNQGGCLRQSTLFCLSLPLNEEVLKAD